ncbi:MAG: pitrilysin family protein [Polyangiales bacterium]
MPPRPAVPRHLTAALFALAAASPLAHADPPRAHRNRPARAHAAPRARPAPPAAPPSPPEAPAAPPPDPLAASLDEAARAAEADPRVRRRPPLPDPAAMLPAMRVERFSLPNGLDVVLSPEAEGRQVVVGVEYRVGTGDCPPARASLAHLAEHLTYGPTRHAPDGLLVEVERADATVFNGITSVDRTRYFAAAPAGSLERLLWIEGERMAFSLDAVTDGSVGHERSVVANEYRQRVADSPAGDLDLAVARELYPEGHLRRAPHHTADEIAAVTPADVRAFLRAWYVPANARLTVTGRFDPARARAWVQRYFGDIPAAPAPRRERGLEPPRLTQERVLRYRAPQASEGVEVHWATPALHAPGDAELDVVAELTGRSQAGSLERALVGAGVATRVYVRQHSHDDTSEFVISATAAAGHSAEEVLDIIDRELVQLRRAEPARAEVVGAVARIRRALVERTASLLERAWQAGTRPDPDDPGHLRGALALYAAVTPGAVRRAAARWLPLDRRLVVILQGDPRAPASGVVESVRSR